MFIEIGKRGKINFWNLPENCCGLSYRYLDVFFLNQMQQRTMGKLKDAEKHCSAILYLYRSSKK